MIKNNKTSIYFNATELERINAYIGDNPIDSYKELILHAISQPVSNGVTTEAYAKLKADFDELAKNQNEIVAVSRDSENEVFSLSKKLEEAKNVITKQGKRIAELEVALSNAQKKEFPQQKKPEVSQQKKTTEQVAKRTQAEAKKRFFWS